jgi:hypothetical protein
MGELGGFVDEQERRRRPVSAAEALILAEETMVLNDAKQVELTKLKVVQVGAQG